MTGVKRSTLSRIEDDWGVFMLFMDQKTEGKRDDDEQLIIFGPRRARRGAELKIMSTIEGKCPGCVTKDLEDTISDDDWGTDVYRFKGPLFSCK